jgi:hypothetical protein
MAIALDSRKEVTIYVTKGKNINILICCIYIKIVFLEYRGIHFK